MNFTDSDNEVRTGGKPADRKSNDEGQTPGASSLDKAAMDSAQRAESRMINNEQTNSSNTTFSK